MGCRHPTNPACLFLLQNLVHTLAALALMGLGCLWQLMNMSANFAHARRDMGEVPSHKYQQFISGVSLCQWA